jgi:pyridoxamine 5'-phosphate oxidase
MTVGSGASDPIELLHEWCGVGYSAEPSLMTLGTIDLDGEPDARSVLLSGVDEHGRLLFHTDIRSRKCAQIDRHPQVSLTLAWPANGRQLVVTGFAMPSRDGEADRAWAARSRYLRLLGWLNQEDLVRRPLEQRQARWAEFDAAHPEGSLTRPAWWVGYAVSPRRITAWTAGRGIGSMRREYRRVLGTEGDLEGYRWTEEVLAG